MSVVYSIYALVDPRDMKVFYIGKTSRAPQERFEEHIQEVSGDTPKQKRLREIYDDTGLIPDFIILEDGIECNKAAFTREVYWVEIFRMAGIVLTNSSVDYEGVHFLTESHYGPIRKKGHWSVDISIDKLISDFSTREFFQIELYPTFTPIKAGNIKADINFSKERKLNFTEGRLLNHGLPITVEEVMLVQHRFEQGDTVEVLEAFFQRSRKSIEYMICIELEGKSYV